MQNQSGHENRLRCAGRMQPAELSSRTILTQATMSEHTSVTLVRPSLTTATLLLQPSEGRTWMLCACSTCCTCLSSIAADRCNFAIAPVMLVWGGTDPGRSLPSSSKSLHQPPPPELR